MEICFTNRPHFENIAALRRRVPIMHRWGGALTLALLIGFGGGCANNSRAERVLALQQYHDLLEDQWQVDIATERDEVRRQIGEMRKKVEGQAETIGETEQWMTKRRSADAGRPQSSCQTRWPVS